ncbi:nuclear transport factor 2 family protein [Nocardia cerradoensis]|uniref:Steroid Delta-isomerase n=1 Tax=Nocardia cerradoensis TaxID=85688 RepID=A0A231GV30_9NOCA|nr:nuclear transport factor 2 family protein [Nocardia cerradoensis]NKY43615.1 SnoaL-like domain-containing protein [Nocardia cerradoensis]OXR40456.1 Steroid Delta-isomerase [Nocardia cerradoensis]
MVDAAKIRLAVERYVATVGSGTSAEIAALFSEHATLEDPVGSEPLVGRVAIEKFYAALDSVKTSTELRTVRVAGDSAAFVFRVVTVTADKVIAIEPIDVMTFDADARITSMRAFWSVVDVQAA